MFYYKAEEKRKRRGSLGNRAILFSEPKGGNARNEKKNSWPKFTQSKRYSYFDQRRLQMEKVFIPMHNYSISGFEIILQGWLIYLNLVVAQSFQYHLS